MKNFTLFTIILISIAVTECFEKKLIPNKVQKGDIKNQVNAAHSGDVVDQLNKYNVDVDYIPQKPAQNISEEILRKNPRLSYLGSFFGRNYYIERTRVNQNSARVGCRNMGMQLVRFVGWELNAIYQWTTSADNYAWTDGRNFRNPAGFRWEYNTENVSESLQIVHYETLGLAIERYGNSIRLATRPPSSLQYYICFCE